ncbi:hypothetical protein MGYG_01406 [Nannizzia gypsea CBS 118893]|uniref:Cytochrome P450 n=1 Tax=Arthroderma gypseum (strain ATCC MYA-4604 / CBS 118893) TaxID=535722 RepID=E5R0N1_ARTGP|nr:hypothetical protein MGYG_01406 [Nannizzia gypsea CBS 118893]EFQ98375.1 hypothetical protein MGYG_01406 [Nannizzia gypsea CBS 118893]
MILSLLLALVLAGAVLLHALRYQPYSIDLGLCLLLAALFCLAVTAYKVLVYPFLVSPLRHIPTPKGHWLLGQTIRQLRASSPHAAAVDWMREFPSADLIRPLMLGNLEVVLVSSPRALREVSQAQCYSFVKPGFLFRTAGEIIGETGVFFAEGDAHRQQRKSLAGPFLMGNVKRSMPIMLAKGDQLAGCMGALLSDYGDVIEVTSVIAKATVDLIAKAVLGYDLDSLTHSSEFYVRSMEVMHLSTTDQIMLALNNFFPARKWIPLKANRRFLHANNVIKQLLEDHVKQRISELSQESDIDEKLGSTDTDIFTMILRGYIERGQPLCQDVLVSQLRTLMVAGHESTSNSVIWCLHMLSTHPSVQTRLRTAIYAATSNGSFTYDSIQSIEYLDHVIKEATRILPPFVSLLRTAAQDVDICGTLIPAGTLLMMYPAVSQLNPSIWGPNVDEFDPDRWYNLPKAAHDPYVYQTFHSGTRVCVGRAFALLEIKVFLVKLLLKWEFHAVDKKVKMPWSGFALKPTNALRLRVTPATLP